MDCQWQSMPGEVVGQQAGSDSMSLPDKPATGLGPRP